MRGQYDGYRDVEGVAAGLDTETFVALRLEIDNWRWDGVPFFIRAGKELPVEGHRGPGDLQARRRGSGSATRMRPDPDEFVIRIEPDPGAELCLLAKTAGEDGLHRVHLDLLFEEQVGDAARALRAAAADALDGNPSSSRARTRSRRRGGSSSRCSTIRRRSRATSAGPGAPRRPATC